VQKAIRNLKPKFLLIVHDELDKSFGEFRLKENGSARGHNGLRDVIAKLGTDKFWRFQVGIGRPASRSKVSRYVLENFTKTEENDFDDGLLNELCEEVEEVIKDK